MLKCSLFQFDLDMGQRNIDIKTSYANGQLTVVNVFLCAIM